MTDGVFVGHGKVVRVDEEEKMVAVQFKDDADSTVDLGFDDLRAKLKVRRGDGMGGAMGLCLPRLGGFVVVKRMALPITCVFV